MPPNACVKRVLPAGTYTIEATTGWMPPYPGDTGDFRISLYAYTPTTINVSDSDPIAGSIDGTQYSVGEMGNYAAYYEFTIGSDQDIYIDMAAPTLNTELILRDVENGFIWSMNDDCGFVRPLLDGDDSCIESLPLSAGTWVIEATTSWSDPGNTGAFDLYLY